MARRRTIEEIDSFTDVHKPIPNSTVSGTLTSLSPVEAGRNASFFEGTLADYTAKIRVVGFETFQQKKLCELFEQKATVKLVNCEVKQARSGDGFEILLKRYTEIKESPNKLDFESINSEQCFIMPTTIVELENLDQFDKATVHAKVWKVNSSETISDLPHQDIVIADSTGTIRVSLWSKGVDMITENSSYCFKNFTIRLYQCKKYLNQSKNQSFIEEIDDVGDAVDEIKRMKFR